LRKNFGPPMTLAGWADLEGRKEMPHGPRTLDGMLLKALEDGGPATVDDILKHFERRVRIRLEKLRVRGIVLREGRGGPHGVFTYRLLRPDLAAKALSQKGGGLSRRVATLG
jgi:hypothetical protein